MAAERTAFEILKAAQDELGLTRSAAFTSTDVSTRQLTAFLNATVEECIQVVDWSGVEKEAVIEIGDPTEISATLTDGSATITVASSAPFAANPTAWAVIGDSIQNGTRITAVPDGTTITLSKTAQATGVEDITIVRDTFAFPSDFAHWIPQTQWDSSLMWEMLGPTSAQWDAFQRNGVVGVFPRRQFRRTGPLFTAFRIFPAPNAAGSYPSTLTYTYISNEPIIAAGGSTKRFFTASDDTTIIPDRLLILGTKWRWKEAKGFDFGPLQAEYYNWMDSAQVLDQGEAVVSLSNNGSTRYGMTGGRYNIPDGNFPGE